MLTARKVWHSKCRAPESALTAMRCAPEKVQSVPRRQRGAHLIEALIAIAIFSFGVLGLVGVLASSIRVTDEARLRSEASLLAHALIAEMWTTPGANLDAHFALGGAALDAWRARVEQLLPAATMKVDLDEPGLSAQSRSITVSISWRLPGSTERHRFVTSAQIGRNP
jgi:type IV pilus assembly protein PilV